MFFDQFASISLQILFHNEFGIVEGRGFVTLQSIRIVKEGVDRHLKMGKKKTMMLR